MVMHKAVTPKLVSSKFVVDLEHGYKYMPSTSSVAGAEAEGGNPDDMYDNAFVDSSPKKEKQHTERRHSNAARLASRR